MSTRSLKSKLRKSMSLRASAALAVGACLGLGVYTTVAEGNDPELNPVNAMNDVLFVGVMGALIDSTVLENARTDRAFTNSTFFGSAPTDSASAHESTNNAVLAAGD